MRLRLLAAAFLAAAVAGTAPGNALDRPQRLEIAFEQESYAQRSAASLRLYSPTRRATVQIVHVGPEPGHTTQRDVVHGVPVGPRAWIGARAAGTSIRVRVGNWPSGLYFARVEDSGRLAFAPFVLRPRILGEHPIAVVLPTQTWQAYNFRDDDGDGHADTWYSRAASTVRMDRPFLDRGVPPHFRHYDLPFLHWVARTGKRCDFLSDADLGAANGRALARAYDLIVFPGHQEYVTAREYDATETYRHLGGNLMFLGANDFFWRVDRRGSVLTRAAQWRDLKRPEAALIGVQYRANDKFSRRGPWVLRGNRASPWLVEGTRLGPGSRIGSGGIEIDARADASPRVLRVLAQIPALYGLGYTAQMTYYETSAGAKVFAAGALGLVESVYEPDAPLPNHDARQNRHDAVRVLENVWSRLAAP